jgi:hypothetical protein
MEQPRSSVAGGLAHPRPLNTGLGVSEATSRADPVNRVQIVRVRLQTAVTGRYLRPNRLHPLVTCLRFTSARNTSRFVRLSDRREAARVAEFFVAG